MPATCRRCSRPSPDAFLCRSCCDDLNELLTGMAHGNSLRGGEGRWSRPWLVSLEDAALGHTRLGESQRHGSDCNSPLPFGEIASTLFDSVKAMLSTWVRHLLEARGVSIPDTIQTAVGCAAWLAQHVDAVAQDEAAGDIFNDIANAIVQIERVVNRPVPDRYLGPCPVALSDGNGERICSMQLTASREATSVQCSQCKTTHSVAELHEAQMRTTDQMSFSISELYRLILPVVREYVPMRTLQHWAARGTLVPTGHDRDGEPRYLLADVRYLREKRHQSKPTGATAHKSNAARLA